MKGKGREAKGSDREERKRKGKGREAEVCGHALCPRIPFRGHLYNSVLFWLYTGLYS
jgi:hypothetical protein